MTNEQKTPAEMTPAKMVIRMVIYIAIMGAILFLCAGRVDWIVAWVWLVVHFIVVLTSATIVPIDPELVDERTHVKEGVKKWDKIIVFPTQILMPFGFLVLAGLDMRYGWSSGLPLWLQISAVIVGGLGYMLSVWASAVNRFYSRLVRIQKERGHHVVSEGPYKYIRHPGYIGVIIFMLTTPLALNSMWTLTLGGALSLLLVIRTVLEDKTLQEELEGYTAYTQKVKYRLVPGLW
ncbi:MAG: isoprenylcysteine carboxylmethyltransferase family protein [Anaerolineales bacterium]|jgi:protein-S-isoprenylcysteine O-methyltransferase Ste14